MVQIKHLTGFDKDLKRQKGAGSPSEALRKVMRRPDSRTDGRCYTGGERLKKNPEAEKVWEYKLNEKEQKEIERLNNNLKQYND